MRRRVPQYKEVQQHGRLTLLLARASGESAELFIDAHVPDVLPDALPALRQRWRALCDGARVDVCITDADAPSHAPPLFRQDARLTITADARKLTLRCDVLVRVRSEFWGRPLLLRVRVTPPTSSDDGGGGALQLAREPLDPTLRLANPLQHDLVLRLIREEPAAAEPLVRSLECEIRVSKPLQLRAETRYMGGERVCIVARAANTDPSLELKLLDLQLHLSESYSMTAAESSSSSSSEDRTANARTRSSRQQQRAQATSRRGRPTRQFRVVSDAHGQLPVILRGVEQFNFLFVLEAVDGLQGHVVAGEEDGDEYGGSGEQERAASMSRNDRGAASSASDGIMKRRKSSSSVLATSIPDANSSAAAAARSSKRVGATQTHQTLLTLSWEASSPGGDRLAPPITEHHTIIWSPQLQSRVTSAVAPQHLLLSGSSLLPASAFTSLVVETASSSTSSSGAAAAVRTVRLDAQRALSLSLATLPQQVAVGEVVTLCLVIANRSTRTSFDLTLLAPFAQPASSGASASASSAGASWFSFEATHRLGYVACHLCVCGVTMLTLFVWRRCTTVCCRRA